MAHANSGRDGLDERLVLDVKKRLARKETQRGIARDLGINRKTVGKIAHGTHISQTRGFKIGWCPKHGARVVLPCIACKTQQFLDDQKGRQPRTQERAA